MNPVSIIDPRKIVSGFPYWVFYNNTQQIIAELIDTRTDIAGIRPFNHGMVCIDPASFVAQNMTIFNAYREVPMSNYMVKGGQLAFVQFVNANDAFAKAFRDSVENRLAQPSWKNCYDFIGIFGQAIGQDWIHTPGLEYCSVDILRHAVNSCPNLPKSDQQVINNIPRESNPEYLWQMVINNPNTFNIYGYWDADVGITV